jgi:hypothetical protein
LWPSRAGLDSDTIKINKAAKIGRCKLVAVNSADEIVFDPMVALLPLSNPNTDACSKQGKRPKFGGNPELKMIDASARTPDW